MWSITHLICFVNLFLQARERHGDGGTFILPLDRNQRKTCKQKEQSGGGKTVNRCTRVSRNDRSKFSKNKERKGLNLWLAGWLLARSGHPRTDDFQCYRSTTFSSILTYFWCNKRLSHTYTLILPDISHTRVHDGHQASHCPMEKLRQIWKNGAKRKSRSKSYSFFGKTFRKETRKKNTYTKSDNINTFFNISR